jgi:hypothetical protein
MLSSTKASSGSVHGTCKSYDGLRLVDVGVDTTDSYYIWPRDMGYQSPLLLVSECQFMELMNQIDKQFPHLEILTSQSMQRFRDRDLLVDFPEHAVFTPRYLDMSTTKAIYERIASWVPDRGFQTDDELPCPPPDDGDVKTFKDICDGVLASGKGKKSKAERNRAQQKKREASNSMFKRTQRYLGLRQVLGNGAIHPSHPFCQSSELTAPTVPPDPSNDPNLTSDEKMEITQTRVRLLHTHKIDISLPVPHPFHTDAVLIAIDVEAWECDQSVITEVGLAVLDTRKLSSMPPGRNGESWFKLIEARHLRMMEYEHLVNEKYVRGNPLGFNFGTSEPASVHDVSYAMEDIFDSACSPSRPIVLVGHDLDSDIRYLGKLGFTPLAHRAVADSVDTQGMWRCVNGFNIDGQTKLASLLDVLGVPYSGLHNAGNDAVYTMQACLGLAVLEGSLRM